MFYVKTNNLLERKCKQCFRAALFFLHLGTMCLSACILTQAVVVFTVLINYKFRRVKILLPLPLPPSSGCLVPVSPICSVKTMHTAPKATKQEDLEFFWSKCWEWEVSNKMLYLFPVFKSGNIMWHNIFVYYMYSRMLSIMHHKMVEARIDLKKKQFKTVYNNSN